MAAAGLVVEEVLGACRQTDLLAIRRSLPSATPPRSTRRSDLVADLAAECDRPGGRQKIFTHVLASWSMLELRIFKARLKGLGCMIGVGPRPRKKDLIAAIINTTEYALGTSKVAKDPCSRSGSVSKDPSAPSMVLVAFDSAAAPVKMQRKLFRRWSKKWARYNKKKERNHKLKCVKDELGKALQILGEKVTVGELCAMVAQTLDLPLDGKYRLRFDRAWRKLMSPPQKSRRARCRFTIAKSSVHTLKTSSKSSRCELA